MKNNKNQNVNGYSFWEQRIKHFKEYYTLYRNRTEQITRIRNEQKRIKIDSYTTWEFCRNFNQLVNYNFKLLIA